MVVPNNTDHAIYYKYNLSVKQNTKPKAKNTLDACTCMGQQNDMK